MQSFRYTESENMKRSTHYGSNYFEFTSHKTNKLVRCFSTLEYYNAMMLEVNSKVVYYLVQPCKAHVKGDDGFVHTLTPDVYVVYDDDIEEIQEVKPASMLTGTDEKSLDAQKQIVLERRWSLSSGMLFSVRSEKEIFMNNMILIANIIYIYHQSKFRSPLYSSLSNRISDILSDHDKHPIRELALLTKQTDRLIMSTVCRMYSEGLLELNIKKRKLDVESEAYYGKA